MIQKQGPDLSGIREEMKAAAITFEPGNRPAAVILLDGISQAALFLAENPDVDPVDVLNLAHDIAAEMGFTEVREY